MKKILLSLIALSSISAFSSPFKSNICRQNQVACEEISNVLFQDNLHCADQFEQCAEGGIKKYIHSYNPVNTIDRINVNKRLANAMKSSENPWYPLRIINTGEELPIGKMVNTAWGKDETNCSATLISDNEIMTAVHCINRYSKQGQMMNISKKSIDYVMKNYRFVTDNGLRSKFTKIEFFKRSELLGNIKNLEGKVPYSQVINDIVKITLSNPIGKEIGFFKIFKGNYSKLLGEKFKMGGYPGVITWDKLWDNTHTSMHFKKYISNEVCEIDFIYKTVLHSNCRPAAGISGGAIFYTDEKTSERFLIGVLSSAYFIEGFVGSRWTTMIGLD